MSKTIRPRAMQEPRSEMTKQAILRGGGGPHRNRREKRANNKSWKKEVSFIDA
jgi:hypothetical protein